MDNPHQNGGSGGVPGHLYSIYAAQELGCAVVWLHQHAAELEAAAAAPTILIVGDDTHEALGPTAFHEQSLAKFVGTCRAAVVVACAPHPDPYNAAAILPILMGVNTILIETRPEREQEWVDFLERAQPGLQLLRAITLAGMRAQTKARKRSRQ